MTWFAFKGLNGGKPVDLAGTQEKQAVAEGFHGYGTQAQAQSNPNSVNVVTEVLADGWIADYNAAVKENAQPGGANANILNPATAAKASTSFVENSIPGLSTFLDDVTSANLWIRAAKVIIGGTLLIIGIAHITGSDHVVMQAARKVPLPI